MNSRQPAEGLPEGALEVVHVDSGEVVGWVWEEAAEHILGRSHWRFATNHDGVAYVSPWGFLMRAYVVARVAVIKGVVSHHLRVQGD